MPAALLGVEDLVVGLRARAAGDVPGLADRDALDRLDRDDRLREAAVELLVPGDVGAEARDEAERAHLEVAAEALVLLAKPVDLLDHRRRGVGVEAANGRLVDGLEVGELQVALGSAERDRGDLEDVAADLDSERAQELLGEGAGGDPRRGLAGAGALEDIAHVAEAVLLQAGEVGVARPGQMRLLDLRVHGPGVHPHVPVRVVAVGDEESDGLPSVRPCRIPERTLDRVALDLHAAAAAVSKLPARHVAVERLAVELQARGQALDDRDEAGAV